MSKKYQGSNALNALVQLIHTEFGNRETKIVSREINTVWSGNKQTIYVEGVTANSTVDIVLGVSATEEQAFQYNALKLKDAGQSTGSITIQYTGDVNTVNIPINVIVRGD